MPNQTADEAEHEARCLGLVGALQLNSIIQSHSAWIWKGKNLVVLEECAGSFAGMMMQAEMGVPLEARNPPIQFLDDRGEPTMEGKAVSPVTLHLLVTANLQCHVPSFAHTSQLARLPPLMPPTTV